MAIAVVITLILLALLWVVVLIILALGRDDRLYERDGYDD